MRYSRTHRLISLVLVLLSCVGASAQMTLGPQRFVNARARTLRNPTSVRAGTRSLAYLGRVGGVAFDQQAAPARGLRFSSLTLDYRRQRADGRRLQLTIDGQEVAAPLHDWQLIPVAKFANSSDNACFTLFGELEDAGRQREVRARRGRVLGYHPAFVNTLMGLRLLQLDSLIIHPYSHDLMKDGGRYILGAGETRPNVRANMTAQLAFLNFFDPLAYEGSGAGRGQKFQSYVISDRDRSVTFDVRNGALRLTGQPSYYFWRLNPRGRSDSDRVVPVSDLSNRVSARTDLLRGINPTVWDAGVVLMRYAAFFRYCKRVHPEQWQRFMAQINAAPAPTPRVTTPNIMEPLR